MEQQKYYSSNICFWWKIESSFLFEESVVGPLQTYWNERKEILLSLQQGVCPEVSKYNHFLHRLNIPKKNHLYDMKQCLQFTLCLTLAFQRGLLSSCVWCTLILLPFFFCQDLLDLFFSQEILNAKRWLSKPLFPNTVPGSKKECIFHFHYWCTLYRKSLLLIVLFAML